MSAHAYPGEELELFARATNWKSYWASEIRPYLGKDILEVGAGLGANTAVLASSAAGRWVCLEPDPSLAAQIPLQVAARNGTLSIEVITGIVADLPSDALFDTALYIDVLEHIEHDAAELANVSRFLAPGGTLIVLAPAHPFLFSAFDSAVGHFRRYTRASLRAAGPPGAALERLTYIDTAGVLSSLANRALLRRRTPTPRQIDFWDRMLVPVSRVLDPVLGGRVGKSVLAVWRVRD